MQKQYLSIKIKQMKKMILAAIAFVALPFYANAQDSKFTAGVNVGLPTGDIKEGYSVNFGLDFTYTLNIAKNFDGGLGIGYSHFIAKGQTYPKIEDVGFAPFFVTANYLIADSVLIGMDLGYGIGIAPSENKGGMFYQPKIGYRADEFDVFVGYKTFSVDEVNFSSFAIGIYYRL